MSASSELTHGDVARILQIIDQLSDIEVRLELNGMKLHVRKFGAGENRPPLSQPIEPAGGAKESAPAQASSAVPNSPAAAAVPSPVTAAAASDDSALVAVRAPMLGRFFRASAPTEPPFVEIGSKVEPDDTVGVIEVMKLFSTVKAGVRGTVVKFQAENGAMVEHDAVLLLVKPE